MLESALALPRQTFGGRHLYRTWDEKAGVLLRSLIKNHPLVDGNKRIAMATTFVFLLMNGRFLYTTNDEMVRFALAVAASEPDMSWRAIARWIRARSYEASHLRRVLTVAKVNAPEQVREIEDAIAVVTKFWNWAHREKTIERWAVRTARRAGISADDVWEGLNWLTTP